MHEKESYYIVHHKISDMNSKKIAYDYIDNLLKSLSEGKSTTLTTISDNVDGSIFGIIKSILQENALLEPITDNFSKMLYISYEGLMAKEKGIAVYLQEIEKEFDLEKAVKSETLEGLKLNKYYPILGLIVAVIAVVAPIAYDWCKKREVTDVKLQQISIDNLVHPIENKLLKLQQSLDSVTYQLKQKDFSRIKGK